MYEVSIRGLVSYDKVPKVWIASPSSPLQNTVGRLTKSRMFHCSNIVKKAT